MNEARHVVLLAGGGTGGHIYPNVAVAERLREHGDVDVHFLVSNRPGDTATMSKLGVPFTTSPVRPLPSPRRPQQGLAFVASFHRATVEALALLRRTRVRAVLATGGFVSGPAIVAAAWLGLPRALVNLDAIPGAANRQLARLCTHVFSTYRTRVLPQAERVGLPLRGVSVGHEAAPVARMRLGLEPTLRTLFVTGATHGAESVIRTMIAFVQAPERAAVFRGWQVFHQCGTFDVAVLERAYAEAGVTAKVVQYCDAMGRAYAAADLVLSRAGAGSVAEAWANTAPSVFLPNPYHRDEHQRHNAQPLVDAGGAVILRDLVEPDANVQHLLPLLTELLNDEPRRVAMRQALARTRPPDGAVAVADWLAWAITHAP